VTTLAKNPGNTLGRKYTLGEAPCKGEGCGKITRSKHMTKADHPNTVVRMGRGLCNRCYEAVMAAERATLTELKYPLLQCTVDGCDAVTRSPKDNAALAPGTRRRVSHGRCSECYKTSHAQVPAEAFAKAQSELEAFLAARQKRQEAAARRQQMAQRFGLAS